MIEEWNWARNYRYHAARLHTPETVEQAQELVAHHRKIRALGTRHSFNSIADTTEDLISLARLNHIISIDRERHTVSVEGGIRYGELCQQLHREGYALHNLASLPHISVAGACATATHGSGDANGNLATAVAALEIIAADGEIVTLSREQNSETFAGAVVALGSLGVITRLTLDITPTFQMRQVVYENLPLAELNAHFDEITGSAYSVSLFTDWRSETFTQVWRKQRLTDDVPPAPEPTFFGATLATRPLHPLASLSAENCTEQMGIPGPWHERLPHFRMEFTPSSGEELQSEYIVPRQHALAAIHAVAELKEQIAPHLLICEVRTIAADPFWMSPCYQQACVGIHFTWKQDWPAVERLLPGIEETLAPFAARPHWGKLFTMSPARLESLYEKLPDFRRLLASYDPESKFHNAYLTTYLFHDADTTR